jgi:hypothetical protein
MEMKSGKFSTVKSWRIMKSEFGVEEVLNDSFNLLVLS